MRILITGICGFVGSALAGLIIEHKEEIHGPLEVIGLDNFSRPGSEINRQSLKRLGSNCFMATCATRRISRLFPAQIG